MTMTELAARLALASDDLASMRAELAAESGFSISGAGAGQRLAAHLNEAWQARQEVLAQLSESLSGLAADVRLASHRYAAADGAGDARIHMTEEVETRWTL